MPSKKESKKTRQPCGFPVRRRQQGRQDSNLQPPVLETGALPIELRPWVRLERAVYPGRVYAPGVPRLAQRRALGALFLVLTFLFAGIAAAGTSAGVWPVAVAAAALALWMLGMVVRAWRG